MEGLQIHPHHGRIEDTLRADFAILSFLRDSILSGRLGFVSLEDAYESGMFSKAGCDRGCFRRRVFYQIGLGYADFDPVFLQDDKAGVAVDYAWRDTPTPPVRLSPTGFLRIEELWCALEKYEWWNRYVTPWKKMLWDAKRYRWTIAVFLAGALMLTAFIFWVPMSTFLSNIPFASSVLDTETLSRFDTVRKSDRLYSTRAPAVDSVSRGSDDRIFRITFDDGRVCEIYLNKEENSCGVVDFNRECTGW